MLHDYTLKVRVPTNAEYKTYTLVNVLLRGNNFGEVVNRAESELSTYGDVTVLAVERIVNKCRSSLQNN